MPEGFQWSRATKFFFQTSSPTEFFQWCIPVILLNKDDAFNLLYAIYVYSLRALGTKTL